MYNHRLIKLTKIIRLPKPDQSDDTGIAADDWSMPVQAKLA
jgi:hypothetical protein